MLGEGMKLNAEVILERKAIAGGSCIPLRNTPLIASDIAGHKRHIEKVYKEMLHEACVVDDCCWRFEKMFGCN